MLEVGLGVLVYIVFGHFLAKGCIKQYFEKNKNPPPEMKQHAGYAYWAIAVGYPLLIVLSIIVMLFKVVKVAFK